MSETTVPDTREMASLTMGLPTKSAKIRTLHSAGYETADIARFLKIRYQHARKVIVDGPPKREQSNFAPASDSRPGDSPLPYLERIKLKIGPGGRVVIPAAFRASMDVEEGDTIIATIDRDGIMKLASASAAMRQAQRIVCEAVPAGVSLAESLIEDRRREAAREENNG